MTPPSKAEVERRATRAAARGLVVLRGGRWDGSWYYRDTYLAMPVGVDIPAGTDRRRDYEPTGEYETNPEPGHGRGEVFRHIGDKLPPVPVH